MRRADRLFQIVQILRRGRLVTASAIAAELEVSTRTVYRDVADLMATGVPIDGAAGAGYLLRRGYDLPPLMFTQDEIEALVLGVRMVQTYGDPALRRAAADVLAKAQAVLPESRAMAIDGVALGAYADGCAGPMTVSLEDVRRAIRERLPLHIVYSDGQETVSERSIHPLGLSLFNGIWLLAAWCTMRADFRTFRPDRMRTLEVERTSFPHLPGQDLATFLRQVGQV